MAAVKTETNYSDGDASLKYNANFLAISNMALQTVGIVKGKNGVIKKVKLANLDLDASDNSQWVNADGTPVTRLMHVGDDKPPVEVTSIPVRYHVELEKQGAKMVVEAQCKRSGKSKAVSGAPMPTADDIKEMWYRDIDPHYCELWESRGFKLLFVEKVKESVGVDPCKGRQHYPSCSYDVQLELADDGGVSTVAAGIDFSDMHLADAIETKQVSEQKVSKGRRRK